MTRSTVKLARKHPEIGAVVVAAFLAVLFTVVSGGRWSSTANLQIILQITAILGIMAIGQALVIMNGEIDISVGSVFGICALIYLAVGRELGAPAALVVSLAAAAAIGFTNGLMVLTGGIPALIATLGTLFVFRGISYALTKGFHFAASRELRSDSIYQVFGGTTLGGFNTAIVWFIVLVVIFQLALSSAVYGNHLLAVGGDLESARARGVRVVRTKWVNFVLCSTLAGFAGVLEAAKLGFADGSFGRLMELKVIAAAVMGGCLLAGGRGSIIGAAIGAFVLSGIQSQLIIMGAQPQWFVLLLGLIVVLAVLGDATLTRWLRRS
ncbi:ABC transporter permease [Inquilinus limosus]|uniref:ABC transporter permease n=1 Tax=Inquilinus limosus TaxID=171674 RepID=UPI003F15847A